MKIGYVDVGGGLRDIYGAGVLDWCMTNGVRFDYAIGVSAGSANLTSFLAGQKGRNFVYYYDYSFRPQYMGAGTFIKKGSYFDMDYVYSVLAGPDGENPLDFDKMMADPTEFVMVATNALTGQPRYFTKADLGPGNLEAVKASSSIPVMCKAIYVDGVPYYDGALSDPVPFKKALDAGCDKIVLVLTRPRDTVRTSAKDDAIARLMKPEYRMAAHGLHLRASRYNRAVTEAKELEKEGRLLILAPDSTCGVDTAKRTKDSLYALYKKGVEDSSRIESFLQI